MTQVVALKTICHAYKRDLSTAKNLLIQITFHATFARFSINDSWGQIIKQLQISMTIWANHAPLFISFTKLKAARDIKKLLGNIKIYVYELVEKKSIVCFQD